MRITARLANPVTDNPNHNANNATRLKASPAFITLGFSQRKTSPSTRRSYSTATSAATGKWSDG